MHSLLLFTLNVFFALAAVHAAPQGQPSNVPSCTFSCPHQDQLGFAFGPPINDGTYLYCVHFPVYCRYSATNGALNLDDDGGHCPASAISSCGTRRRSAVPRAPSPPMAAPVARAPTPENVKIRASLKRRKPVSVDA